MGGSRFETGYAVRLLEGADNDKVEPIGCDERGCTGAKGAFFRARKISETKWWRPCTQGNEGIEVIANDSRVDKEGEGVEGKGGGEMSMKKLPRGAGCATGWARKTR